MYTVVCVARTQLEIRVRNSEIVSMRENQRISMSSNLGVLSSFDDITTARTTDSMREKYLVTIPVVNDLHRTSFMSQQIVRVQ
jgi:hypothetical protein